MDILIAVLPAIVGLLYFTVAFCYLCKGDYAWAIVWASYAMANIGLIMVGMK